jgi:hypothetical protein
MEAWVVDTVGHAIIVFMVFCVAGLLALVMLPMTQRSPSGVQPVGKVKPFPPLPVPPTVKRELEKMTECAFCDTPITPGSIATSCISCGAPITPILSLRGAPGRVPPPGPPNYIYGGGEFESIGDVISRQIQTAIMDAYAVSEPRYGVIPGGTDDLPIGKERFVSR